MNDCHKVSEIIIRSIGFSCVFEIIAAFSFVGLFGVKHGGCDYARFDRAQCGQDVTFNSN